MIRNMTPLSMAESLEFVKNSKDEGKEVKAFIKKFTELNEKDAKELRAELKKLNLMKVNDKDISKVIDVFPENRDELNKVLISSALDDEEAQKILEIVKGFK